MRGATVRLMTRAGAWLARHAKSMAESLTGAGSAQAKHRIVDGFLIQAKRVGRVPDHRCTAIVADLPSFLLMPGFNRITPTLTLFMPGVPVGTRDDLLIPDNGSVHAAVSSPGNYRMYLLQPTGSPDDLGASITSYAPANAPAYQERAMLGYGYFMAGLAQPAWDDSFYALDDMSYFTFAENCTVGCGMMSPYASATTVSFSEDGIPSTGGVSTTYLNGAGLWITEEDLEPGWRLHPRRQVPHTAYTSIYDPYRVRRSPGAMNTGFLFTQAPTMELVGEDSYCVAARAFKQHVGTFYNDPPGTSYRPPYYDQDGEQALVIVTGHYDRADYALTPGEVAHATIDSIRYVLASTLPMVAIRPTPAVIPGNPWGRPPLPAVGKFFSPWVGRTSDGYVVFSQYTTYLDWSDEPGGTAAWVGNATALVVSLPNGTDEVYTADWDSSDTAPLLPGTDPGVVVVPTIIGGVVVSVQVGAGPDPVFEDRAYCFVWEHRYNRSWIGNQQMRGAGGQIVVYTVSGNSVTRQVITSDYAPLFASAINRKPGWLDQLSYDADTNNVFSNVTSIGNGKVAFAVVATPVAMPSTSTTRSIPEHEIRVLTFDVNSSSFSVGGPVCLRNTTTRKCLLSAPRLESVNDDGIVPAILLASVTDAEPSNRGAGKVYIRPADNNGELPWREYVTDMGGQAGAFYVGNKLWWFDNTKPLTKGGAR